MTDCIRRNHKIWNHKPWIQGPDPPLICCVILANHVTFLSVLFLICGLGANTADLSVLLKGRSDAEHLEAHCENKLLVRNWLLWLWFLWFFWICIFNTLSLLYYQPFLAFCPLPENVITIKNGLAFKSMKRLFLKSKFIFWISYTGWEPY